MPILNSLKWLGEQSPYSPCHNLHVKRMVIKCRPARCLVIKQWAGAPGQAGQQRPGLSCLAWSGEKKWTFNYVLITSPSHLQGPPPPPRGEHSNKKTSRPFLTSKWLWKHCSMLKTFNIILFPYPFCLATGEECCPMQAPYTRELLLQAAPAAYQILFTSFWKQKVLGKTWRYWTFTNLMKQIK